MADGTVGLSLLMETAGGKGVAALSSLALLTFLLPTSLQDLLLPAGRSAMHCPAVAQQSPGAGSTYAQFQLPPGREDFDQNVHDGVICQLFLSRCVYLISSTFLRVRGGQGSRVLPLCQAARVEGAHAIYLYHA